MTSYPSASIAGPRQAHRRVVDSWVGTVGESMRFTQIASDGGLLPKPITRDSFELWPAKRREFIVDFTRYQDGTPTTKGDVIYLTNVMKMPNGRMWATSSRFSTQGSR